MRAEVPLYSKEVLGLQSYCNWYQCGGGSVVCVCVCVLVCQERRGDFFRTKTGKLTTVFLVFFF